MRLFERIIRIVFPSRCIGCGKIIDRRLDVCPSCEDGFLLSVIGDGFCKNCGKPKKQCVCKSRRFEFSSIAVPFIYSPIIKNAILRIKIGRDVQPADLICEYMAERIRKYSDIKFDMIVSVPMTEKERARRGIDQSAVLAKRLSRLLCIPFCNNAIKKVFETHRQHTLPVYMRNGNTFGAFDADSFLVSGKTVLLVDDIATTCNTLNECAKMLKLAGAKEVHCAAAATTVISPGKEEIKDDQT